MVKDRTPGCDGLSPTWLPWLPCGVGLHRTAAGSAPDVRVWPSLPVWHTRERRKTDLPEITQEKNRGRIQIRVCSPKSSPLYQERPSPRSDFSC